MKNDVAQIIVSWVFVIYTTYHTILTVDAVDVDFGKKFQRRRLVRITLAAFYFQWVHSVFIWSLGKREGQVLWSETVQDNSITGGGVTLPVLTLGGPMIMPVQWVRVMSSSFSRPHDMVPSPTPFCPASSSSSRRKFRGTTAEGVNTKMDRSRFISAIIRITVLCFMESVTKGKDSLW